MTSRARPHLRPYNQNSNARTFPNAGNTPTRAYLSPVIQDRNLATCDKAGRCLITTVPAYPSCMPYNMQQVTSERSGATMKVPTCICGSPILSVGYLRAAILQHGSRICCSPKTTNLAKAYEQLCRQRRCIGEQSLRERLRIPTTMDLSRLRRLTDFLIFFLGKLDLQGTKVLLQALQIRCSRNREDIIALTLLVSAAE
jgi:hypothetical protein